MTEGPDQLREACAALSIVQVARELGIALKEGGGQRSPFREDSHAGSFSVLRSGFKDHAVLEHKGGHFKFVQLARPGWSKQEVAQFLIRAAGMEPIKMRPGTMKRHMAETRARMYSAEQSRAEDLPALPVPVPPRMAEAVLERWNEGQAAILPHLGKLAESRGWPESALRAMVGANKTSLPLLPWADGGDRRGWGWVVERPEMGPSGAGRLEPVGFHVRYRVFDKAAGSEGKRWVYVPYVPERGTSEFQRGLAAANVRLPAYPFVLGDLVAPRLVVVMEGQFDVVSFALAMGWLERGGRVPPGVVLLGLRGVSSPSVLLAAYGLWLRRHRPFVWVIGDNDEAGRTLVRRTNAGRFGEEPSFLDRLRAQGCRVAGRYYAVPGCKDFNDVWRAHRPARELVQAMADEAGCGELLSQGG